MIQVVTPYVNLPNALSSDGPLKAGWVLFFLSLFIYWMSFACDYRTTSEVTLSEPPRDRFVWMVTVSVTDAVLPVVNILSLFVCFLFLFCLGGGSSFLNSWLYCILSTPQVTKCILFNYSWEDMLFHVNQLATLWGWFNHVCMMKMSLRQLPHPKFAPLM